jgi:hypothetical protein
MTPQRSIQDPSNAVEPAAGEPERDEPEQELIEYLEPDQLVAETFRPVARAVLTRNVAVGLWALRVFVVLVSLMVIYTFIASLS